jgi:hypothetical protein
MSSRERMLILHCRLGADTFNCAFTSSIIFISTPVTPCNRLCQ